MVNGTKQLVDVVILERTPDELVGCDKKRCLDVETVDTSNQKKGVVVLDG